MTTEHEDSDLNTSQPFDMNSFIEDIIARGDNEDDPEAESDEVEDGPSDEGELPEDEDFAGADESEESEEDADEEETEESETSEEEGTEAKAEATPDPKDEEIGRLKDLVLQSQQQSQQLMQLLVYHQQQQRAQVRNAPEPPNEFDDLSEDLIENVLFGGDPEAAKALDPVTQGKLRKFAKQWSSDQAKFAKNPKALYEQKIRDFVLDDLRTLVGPIYQDRTRDRVQRLIDTHVSDFDESGRQRVAEVFQSLGPSAETAEQALKFAADYVRKERSSEDLSKRERKVEVSERQKQANRESARRKKGRRKVRRPEHNTPPKMKPGEDLWAYYQRVEHGG